MYKIEKGIPIPNKLHGGGPKKKYPFDEMVVGDSFFVSCKKEDSRKLCATLKNSTQRLPNTKFTTVYVKEEKKAGVRIWRIS